MNPHMIKGLFLTSQVQIAELLKKKKKKHARREEFGNLMVKDGLKNSGGSWKKKVNHALNGAYTSWSRNLVWSAQHTVCPKTKMVAFVKFTLQNFNHITFIQVSKMGHL